MADDPNMNFGAFSQSLCNQQVVSFQTSATTSGLGGMPVYLDCPTGMDANVGMLRATPSVVVPTSSSNMPADSGQNLKYGGPLAADWTHLELQVLRDGMEKYVHEQGIMKYIKIAASLPNKTVRDVAMRCQWTGYAQEMPHQEMIRAQEGKKVNTRRRKPEEHHIGRKIKERKVGQVFFQKKTCQGDGKNPNDKFVEHAHWRANLPVQTDTRVSPFMSHNVQNNLFVSGASEIDRAMQHLLEENNRLLNQIETNILTFQAQHNIDLFHRARRNINDLLQSMSQMPGIMTKIPPLRISVNENLASLVLPGLTMEQILGSSLLKEEPRGW